VYSKAVNLTGVTSVFHPRTVRSDGWYRLISAMLPRKVQLALDLSVLAISFVLAYLLRFDFQIPRSELMPGLLQLPYVLAIQMICLSAFNVHRSLWRYTDMSDVGPFVKATILAFLPVITLRLTLPQQFGQFRVPLSISVMDAVLAFGATLGSRVLWRALYETAQNDDAAFKASAQNRTPVLLIGAGRAGLLAVKEIKTRANMSLEVKGFVDDNREKHGSSIHGVRVLGSTDELPRLVKEAGVDHVIITIARASRRELRRLLQVCEQVPVKARIIPGLHEILQGKVEFSSIRDVQIEDLLGRESIQLDEGEMARFLAGKVVMVTGAGGSIGSELARQIARFNVASLLLVERAEFSLFRVDRELRAAFADVRFEPLVADVGDRVRMRSIFGTHRPQVVLHAAAHKHVPMMEHNLTEAVTNNILATHSLAELAGQSGVEVFVQISTDKAVRPTSVMGASKRVAELVIQYLNQSFPTRFVAVRFGNVIGSAGSVIPIFREQIVKGGPVTVTHPDMVRYFMTIPEAAQLVLQASTMGEGGEIFILDMGEPVRILDLARDTILLSGLKPYDDIDIVFTGIRPGEKLVEELQGGEELMTKTRHPKIFIGKIAAYPESKVREALVRLRTMSEVGQDEALRRYLGELMPEAQLGSQPQRPVPAYSGLGNLSEPTVLITSA
jgi:FlaA1/EpsC-like NDP-sugar epimerase